MSEFPRNFFVFELPLPEQWLPAIDSGEFVWLVKEGRLARVAGRFQPKWGENRSDDSVGSIVLEVGGSTAQWLIRPSGCGVDGSQCLLPVDILSERQMQEHHLNHLIRTTPLFQILTPGVVCQDDELQAIVDECTDDILAHLGAIVPGPIAISIPLDEKGPRVVVAVPADQEMHVPPQIDVVFRGEKRTIPLEPTTYEEYRLQ